MKNILKEKTEQSNKTPALELYEDPFAFLLGQQEDGAGELWKPELKQDKFEDIPRPKPSVRQVAKRSGSRIKPKIAPVVDLDIELSTDEDFEENGVPILLPQSKKTFTPTPARK
jgi:hypothetical protein